MKAHDDTDDPDVAGAYRQRHHAVSLRRVGYWRNADDPRTSELPDPIALVDPNWDRIERARVIGYLRSGQEHFACHGYSFCRFKCGISDTRMGTRDLTDGEYVWPEGFAHYLKAHAVKPPEEFLNHVRGKLAQRRPSVVKRLIARLSGRHPYR